MLALVYVSFPAEGQIDGRDYSDKATGWFLSLKYGIHTPALEGYDLRERVEYCWESEYPTSFNLGIRFSQEEKEKVWADLKEIFKGARIGAFDCPALSEKWACARQTQTQTHAA